MDGCGFTLDPAAVRTALDACFAIMERPDSPANLMALGFDYLGAEVVPEYAAVARDAMTVDRLTMDLGA